MAVCGYALSEILTYIFGPISITFIHPFLDDTSRTQAVLRGGPGMLELLNVF
jgi:hypothetical protein